MAFISNLALAFQEVVKENAFRTAFCCPKSGDKTTYSELNVMVDKIAQQLVYRGYKQGDVAVIFHDKSPASFAAMLACLRLGIIYTNLDPFSPWERLRKIFDNCQPSFVMNSCLNLAHEKEIKEWCKVLWLYEIVEELASFKVNLPNPEIILGSSPAYIMFTSGSTGHPKGALISHTNLLWFIGWGQNHFEITSADIFTNVNPAFFDNSVFDFYISIFSGATLVPFTQDQVKNPRLLLQLAGERACTIWFSVPSLLVYLLTTRAISAQSLPSIRKIIFGGEGFPKPKLKQIFEMFNHRADLENVYGPTECTCICSAHTVDSSDFEDMQNYATLGRLSSNFSGKILPSEKENKNFGELLLLGPHVGMGYYNDIEQSNQKFIQDPFNTSFRDIGYLTGDLVFCDSYGRLHFKGRKDFQIKHMGYRIELEEIENALCTIQGIKECAVIYKQIGDGMGQILGFVSCDETISQEQIIAKMHTIVPAYMMPKRILILNDLLKNANGKIDRQALLKSQVI